MMLFLDWVQGDCFGFDVTVTVQMGETPALDWQSLRQ